MKKLYECELKRLQKEYNEIHERMGYMRNTANIAAANRALDIIVEKMEKILQTRERSKEKSGAGQAARVAALRLG